MANSAKPGNNKSGGNKIGGKRSSATKKTSGEIVRRHFSDINSKITDSDFEDLEIDTSLPGNKAQQPLEIKEGKERPKDAEKDNKTITPWDVISE
jgi:hypothetical protein